MPPRFPVRPSASALQQTWPGWAVWIGAWSGMMLLDGRIDLANQAMGLVLASAFAALWLTPQVSLSLCTLAVLAFNLVFVEPRGRLTIDVHQHGLLLLTMLVVSWIVSLLMARQRRLAAIERDHAVRAEQTQALGDALRDADDPRACGDVLVAALAGMTGTHVILLMARQEQSHEEDAASFSRVGGSLSADEQAGLWLCMRQNRAMGPGSGRHEEQPAWYLPLRGRHLGFGAALVRLPEGAQEGAAAAAFSTLSSDVLRRHAQALCDQMGLAIDRAMVARAASLAREEAHEQKLRNTLLAAISHDYRTPLAIIMGAASSLHDQGERLSAAQRQRLSASIGDEARQLARLTDNTLQLARLDAPGLALHLDWEAPEELAGTALRHARLRHPLQKARVRLEPGLPLLHCDALLWVQLLDNLLDNAVKHGGGDEAVELVVRRIADRVVWAVRDRGPGVPPAWKERIFEAFQRGDTGDGVLRVSDASPARGAGVGLALCRAIARAHGGELTYRARRHGGASFECALPIGEPPAPPPEDRVDPSGALAP